MILFSLLGLVAHYAFGVEAGVAIGLLAGFVVANLVPARGACAVRPPEPPAPSERPGEPRT